METILIQSIILIAGFVQGLTGFGSVLISLPLLALILDIKEVIPLVSLFALCINITLVMQLREHLQWQRLLVLLGTTLPGLPLGVYLLKHVSPGILTLVLGIITTLFCLQQLLTRMQPRELGNTWGGLAGFLAGILGGSIGANGPPVILYCTIQPWNKHETKACLAGYFLIAGIGVSTSHALGGMITKPVINVFFQGLPILALGIFSGTMAYRKISGRDYRTMAMILVLLLGMLMLWRGAGSMLGG